MGKVLYYTPEVIEFIRNNADKGSVWLLNELKLRYNINATYGALGSVTKRNKISVKPYKRGWNYYIEEFIQNNSEKYTFEEMQELIEKEFGIKFTLCSLQHYFNRHGFKYVKKQIPIGTERIFYGKGTKENGVPYIWVKIANNKDYRSNWKRKTHYVWEQHNGKIPKGYSVIHLDGDYTNFDITNLRLIHKSLLPQIAKKYGYGIVTETLCEILEFEKELKELKR